MSIINTLKHAESVISNYFFSEVIEDGEEMPVAKDATSVRAKSTQTQTAVTSEKQEEFETIKVSNGPDIVVSTGRTSYASSPKTSVTTTRSTTKVETKPPHLQVMTQKNFVIRTFSMTSFNESKGAADALKQGKCVVLNFENTDFKEQHRICDFLNGACYVLGGSVIRVTSTMVIYAPKGINLRRTNK